MSNVTFRDASVHEQCDWLASLDGHRAVAVTEFDQERIAAFASAVEHRCPVTLPPTWPLALIADAGIWRKITENIRKHNLLALQIEQCLSQISLPRVDHSHATVTDFSWRQTRNPVSGILRARSIVKDADGCEGWRSSIAVLVRPYSAPPTWPSPATPPPLPPDAIPIGRSLRLTRKRIAAYGKAAGDLNPLHKDGVRAAALGLSDVPAQGLLVLGLALSRLDRAVGIPHPFTITARFPLPANAGERLRFYWTASAEGGRMKAITDCGTVMNLRLQR